MKQDTTINLVTVSGDCIPRHLIVYLFLEANSKVSKINSQSSSHTVINIAVDYFNDR